MSESETQYFVEYAKSGRANCQMKGCGKIEKGELRLGTSFQSSQGYNLTKWRHWMCSTPKVIQNIGSIDRLGGYEELNDEDKENIKAAIERGSVNTPEREAEIKAEKSAAHKTRFAAGKKRKEGDKGVEKDAATSSAEAVEEGETSKQEVITKKKTPAKKIEQKEKWEEGEAKQTTESEELVTEPPKKKRGRPKKVVDEKAGQKATTIKKPKKKLKGTTEDEQ